MVQKAFDYLFDTMGTALGYDPKVSAMATGLFFGFLTGLGIYRFFYGGKVQGLEEQIKLLDRQKSDLAEKIKALPEQKQMQLSPEEQRILALAETDRNRIDLAIRLIDCKVRWDPDGDCNHVYFELKVFNGSTYPIRFDKIEGSIEYNAHRVGGRIDFYTGKWPLGTLRPRLHTSIEIVQRLSTVDMNRLR